MSMRRTAAITVVLCLAVWATLGLPTLAALWLWTELNCTPRELRAAASFARTLEDSVPAASGVEVMTYDCDSGGSPWVSYTVTDPRAFWSQLDQAMDCQGIPADLKFTAPPRCDVKGMSFEVSSRRALLPV